MSMLKLRHGILQKKTLKILWRNGTLVVNLKINAVAAFENGGKFMKNISVVVILALFVGCVRHDFAIYDSSLDNCLLKATTGAAGLREKVVQFDPASNCVWSAQGFYDCSNSVLRQYVIGNGLRHEWNLPVFRTHDYFNCAIVEDKFLITGYYDSVTNVLISGAGTSLYALPLSRADPSFEKVLDFGDGRVCLKLLKIGEDRLAAVVYDGINDNMSIVAYDIKSFQEQKSISWPRPAANIFGVKEPRSPIESVVDRNVVFFGSWNFSYPVAVSPSKNYVFAYSAGRIIIYDDDLEKCAEICLSAPAGDSVVVDYDGVGWSGDGEVTLFCRQSGDWLKFDVINRRIVGVGRIKLHPSENDDARKTNIPMLKECLGDGMFYVDFNQPRHWCDNRAVIHVDKNGGQTVVRRLSLWYGVERLSRDYFVVEL